MKIRFVIAFLVASFLTSPEEVNAKTHKLMPTIKFEGNVKDKKPIGEGSLIIDRYYYSQHPFIIVGTFDGDTIRNGEFTIGDNKLCGTFYYNLSHEKDSKIYAVSISLCQGMFDDNEVENLGPISISNKYGGDTSHGGWGFKELLGTEISSDGCIAKFKVLNGFNNDRVIPTEGISEVYEQLDIREVLDRNTYKYVVKFNITSVQIKYDNGICLNRGENNQYELSSPNGNKLTFYKSGKICENNSITLSDNSKITLLHSGNSYSSDDRFDVIYANGNHFIGSLKLFSSSMLSLPNIVNNLPRLENLSSNQLLPQTGEMEYASVSDDVIKERIINGERESVIKALEKEKKDREERLLAEKERARKQKEEEEFNKLVSQYGQKDAQAIKDRHPFVGMSEDAFRKISGYRLHDETATRRVYAYYYGELIGNTWYDDVYLAQLVYCEGGRIVRITNR